MQKTLGAQCVSVAKNMAILWLALHLAKTGMYSAAAEILDPPRKRVTGVYSTGWVDIASESIK